MTRGPPGALRRARVWRGLGLIAILVAGLCGFALASGFLVRGRFFPGFGGAFLRVLFFAFLRVSMGRFP